ncbi:MAG: host-nuclease inhibitor Gam family protein [Janthinobacterium lividum]
MATRTIKPRAPRTVEQATELLEKIARLYGDIAVINAHRDQAIANTNATADALLLPVTAEIDAIGGVIKSWWEASGKDLLPKRRKTMALGGCQIGSKAAPVALTFGNSDDFEVAVERLREQRWAKPYVRVTYAVAKKDTAAMLADPKGRHREQLRALGFGTRGGADAFVLQPVVQAGTVQAKG